MLNTDMQPLLNVPIANDLVDHHADRALGDVEDDARLAVVEFIGQALLLCRISNNVNNVSDFVLLELQTLALRGGRGGVVEVRRWKV
jgi:hypothetical protein